MNAHLFLAKTAEFALMALICTRVSAWLATQETNAKQVRICWSRSDLRRNLIFFVFFVRY